MPKKISINFKDLCRIKRSKDIKLSCLGQTVNNGEIFALHSRTIDDSMIKILKGKEIKSTKLGVS